MNEYLINAKNLSEINSFINKPSHAVILTGKYGYGKRTMAEFIARRLLNLNDLEQLENYPYFYDVKPENNLISIDKVRDLIKIFRLKTTGKNGIRRVVIVEDADKMNEEAQNAILKILEEPPSDSVILFTVSSERSLKPTILSRMQRIKLVKPSYDEIVDFYSGRGYKTEEIKKNYIFANGAIGLISTLLNTESNEYNSYLAEAKSLLSSNSLDKLISIDSLIKDKDSLMYRIFCMKQIAKSALQQAIDKNQEKFIRYWYQALKSIQNCENLLIKGGNTKLLLTDLFLNM